MQPLISLVTGTFNRNLSLQRMLGSFVNNLARGLDFEVIVVDGGSTDGTLDWCHKQQRQADNFHLIEQGELLGAIRAFDTGAYAALGDYVLLANDDIVFTSNSIVPALIHLEMHPHCGAVAFADDRPAPGYGDGFKVQTMSVQTAKKQGNYGDVAQLPYAQVGLFRRWLGNKAGWWGSRDENFPGHTYGGDNYLSARIYELGYTIDAVEAAKVFDTVVPDQLREHNTEQEKKTPGAFYKRYPQPPLKADKPTVKNPQDERLRVLYMPIYEPGYPHQQRYKRGLREALQRVGLVYEIDYFGTRYNLAHAVRDFQPHILLTQCQRVNAIPVEQLVAAREANPEMIVINWNGDVYEHGLTSEAMLAYLRHFDLQLVVNQSVIPIYEAAGIHAAYWQVAPEPVDPAEMPTVPPHDVVFLANAYSDERKALGHMLQGMPGVNVGLYGRGWKWSNGDTTYNFPAGATLYQKAKIAIGDNQYTNQVGFVSNRIFEALASGVFLLHQTVPGLQELTGLEDGVHYIAWSDTIDLQRKIHYWLQSRRDNQRRDIAQAGQAFVNAHHTFDCRVDELLGLIEKVGI